MIIYKLGRQIRTAASGLVRNFWMSFSSATAVAITLSLVSLFLVFSVNVKSFMSVIEENISIQVHILPDFGDDQLYDEKKGTDILGDKIKAVNGVSSVEYRSREDNFNLIVESYSSNNSTYDFLTQDRFEESLQRFPRLYIVKTHSGVNLQEVAFEIETLEGVAYTTTGQGGVEKLVIIFDQVSTVLLFFMTALVILAIFLISNTIKLTIYSRKTEIQIMRLVGASNSYIRFPFILEGIFIGIMGSLVPVTVTLLLYGRLIDGSSNSMLTLSTASFAPMNEIQMITIALVVIGAVVGMIGSSLSVGRYLKI